MSETPAAYRVVLVTGLSGAGKASTLRVLEDLGYDAVDNPPLSMIGALAERAARTGSAPVAIGFDARSDGFDAAAVMAALDTIRRDQGLRTCLVFLWASEPALLRRFTATRRRHPLAGSGAGATVRDGIAAERRLVSPLWDAADLSIDTSSLALPDLRHRIETAFGTPDAGERGARLVPTLVSFAFPAGLPREADMVFDARFLSNPHYIDALRPLTGLDPEVAAYIESDVYFAGFYAHLTGLLELLLPRFVVEGKKYVTIAVGCTGGRHRSVLIVERLAGFLTERGWGATVSHRELGREGAGRGVSLPQPKNSVAVAGDAGPVRREEALQS